METLEVREKYVLTNFGAVRFNAFSISVPNHMLFVTLQQYGEIGFLSLDSAADAGFSLVSRSTKPAAVTFDPVNQVCLVIIFTFIQWIRSCHKYSLML